MRHDYAAAAVWIVVRREPLMGLRVEEQARQIRHEDVDDEAATLLEMLAHARHAGIERVDVEKVANGVPRNEDQGEALIEGELPHVCLKVTAPRSAHVRFAARLGEHGG